MRFAFEARLSQSGQSQEGVFVMNGLVSIVFVFRSCILEWRIRTLCVRPSVLAERGESVMSCIPICFFCFCGF